MTIPTPSLITISPRSLDQRFWELIQLEQSGKATPANKRELDMRSKAKEGGQDD